MFEFSFNYSSQWASPASPRSSISKRLWALSDFVLFASAQILRDLNLTLLSLQGKWFALKLSSFVDSAEPRIGRFLSCLKTLQWVFACWSAVAQKPLVKYSFCSLKPWAPRCHHFPAFLPLTPLERFSQGSKVKTQTLKLRKAAKLVHLFALKTWFIPETSHVLERWANLLEIDWKQSLSLTGFELSRHHAEAACCMRESAAIFLVARGMNHKHCAWAYRRALDFLSYLQASDVSGELFKLVPMLSWWEVLSQSHP